MNELANYVIEKVNLLPDEFLGKGEVKYFKFQKIITGYSNFMYKVEILDKSIHYEVFKRKLTPLCIDFENRVYSDKEFKEVYPKSKDFGIWAWTFNTKELAIEKLKSLEK